MRIALHLAACLLAVATTADAERVQSRAAKKQIDRIEQAHRREAQALVELADAAMVGQQGPSDFALRWRNDFLKAQEGTFVPFIITVDVGHGAVTDALLYVRTARRGATAPDRTNKHNGVPYPFDEIFPIQLTAERPLRFMRGFAVPPGDYDVYIAVRERPANGKEKGTLKASVTKQPLTVPDFWNGELTTSTVILADRLTTLSESVPSEQLAERPYVIGRNDIDPAIDASFRRHEDLTALFLVYNPRVLPDKKFDVQVEYHFFVRNPEGEVYLNRTEPQRFNPAILGPQFDPGSGHPLMAGQAVPLASFQEGHYRLAIRVTDLISGKSITRDVHFTVVS